MLVFLPENTKKLSYFWDIPKLYFLFPLVYMKDSEEALIWLDFVGFCWLKTVKSSGDEKR